MNGLLHRLTLTLHRLVLHRCHLPEKNIPSVCGTLLQCNKCLRIRKVGGPLKEVQALGQTKTEAAAVAAVAKAEGDVAATDEALSKAKRASDDARRVLAGAKAKLNALTE